MDVLMIGHSRSGKTSYMAGLYSVYGNAKEGYGIVTKNKDKDQQLVTLGENLSYGYYPSQTDIEEEYDFWLTYDGRLIIPFNWYDYRGGALLESSKTSDDARKLVEKIVKADALIVFLDGERIKENNDYDLEEAYDVLIWSIMKACSERQADTILPISFVITKGDTYNSYNNCFKTPGYKYFDGIMSMISECKTIKGMAVVCEITSKTKINVVQPLLFSLFYGMDGYIAHEDLRLSVLEKELNEEEMKLVPLWYEGGFGDIDNIVTNVQNFIRVNLLGLPRVESDWEKATKVKEIIEVKKREIHNQKENLNFLKWKKYEMISNLNSFIINNTMFYLNK